MPGNILSTTLKKAISALPDREKDKLLFRLIAKNDLLVRQLEFRLLEDGATTEERREQLEKYLHNELSAYPARFYSPGYLMMHLREISGRINDHVRITRDKTGEIELGLRMLVMALGNNQKALQGAAYGKIFKFNEYVVKRTLKLGLLMHKLHEDYLLEYENDLRSLGKAIRSIDSLHHTAIDLGLNVEDLLDGLPPGDRF